MWNENNELSVEGTRLQCLRLHGELPVPRLVHIQNIEINCFYSKNV